jgi:hypothetical protein
MSPSNLCKHLRTKSMFIPALANATEVEDNPTGHSQHCWCNCTLTETGPDDQPVSNNRCCSSRSCFEE